MPYVLVDEEGFICEPCASCDKAYVDNLFDEWCCGAKKCEFEEEKDKEGE